ncbi:MAG: hypothetical protein R3C11_13085 [Planctomycetaceae bacterium]
MKKYVILSFLIFLLLFAGTAWWVSSRPVTAAFMLIKTNSQNQVFKYTIRSEVPFRKTSVSGVIEFVYRNQQTGYEMVRGSGSYETERTEISSRNLLFFSLHTKILRRISDQFRITEDSDVKWFIKKDQMIALNKGEELKICSFTPAPENGIEADIDCYVRFR